MKETLPDLFGKDDSFLPCVLWLLSKSLYYLERTEKWLFGFLFGRGLLFSSPSPRSSYSSVLNFRALAHEKFTK